MVLKGICLKFENILVREEKKCIINYTNLEIVNMLRIFKLLSRPNLCTKIFIFI